MSDPKHPTNQTWELFDPAIYPPPKGVSLLLINNGGALAWGFKPTIPLSVKERIK